MCIRDRVESSANIFSTNSLLVILSRKFSFFRPLNCLDVYKRQRLGDVLIVGLNSDSSVKRLKGESRPINDENARSTVLAALEAVDYVVTVSYTHLDVYKRQAQKSASLWSLRQFLYNASKWIYPPHSLSVSDTRIRTYPVQSSRRYPRNQGVHLELPPNLYSWLHSDLHSSGG